jgi:flagellin-like hook-associated protein FlgL
MSMITGAVNGSLRDLSKAGKAAAKLGQQLTTGKKVQTPADNPSAWLQASRAQSTAGYLDAVHTGLNELATNINVADTTMQAVGEHLGTMKGLLVAALKLPAGDPNRDQLVAGFNSTRQQIDDLVNTTSQTGARNLMMSPAKNAQAGNILALAGLNGQVKNVHAQQVDTGVNGLNVTNLPAGATDVQIQAALTNLGTAQETLEARRSGLAADAGSISRYLDQGTQVSSFYQSQAESLTGADPTEAAVQLQSVSVQQSLALQSLASISTNRSALLELLK